MIEALLKIEDFSNTKSAPKNQINFLLKLSEEMDKEDFSNLLKDLKISKEDLQNIKSKLPTNEGEKFEELIKLAPSKEELNKTLTIPEKLPKQKEVKTKEPEKNEKQPNHSVLSKLLNDNTQTDTHTFQQTQIIASININSNEDESKKVEIIKKQLESEFKQQNIILSSQTSEKIKNAKNLKELVNTLNEAGFNVTKIKITKEKETIHITKTPEKSKLPKETNNQTQNKALLQNETKQIQTPKPKIAFIAKKSQKTQTKNQNKQTKDQKDSVKHIKTDKTTTPKIEPKNTHTAEIKKHNTTSAQNTNTQNIQTQSTQSQQPQKSLLEEILTQKTPSKEAEKTTQTKHDPQIKTDHQPQENISNNGIITQLKHDIVKAKQSIKKFSSDLNEAIKEYKPPMSKISIEMHPKDLGKVEVTLIHRGDNLQVKINSNTSQPLQFIQTHQNELKQNLINMGYSEVNMSFNANQQQQQQQHQQRKTQQYNQAQEELEEIIIEIPHYTYA